MNYNPELIRALANGDEEAHEEIKSLPITVRMAMGNAVDKLKRDENIVPMSSGFSIYEEQKSAYIDDEAVGKALVERNKLLQEADERKEKLRQEQLEKEVKAKVARARAGLAMHDR